MYDLTDLKVFVMVAKEENVSRGAERCHLSASTVSLRIKSLEDSVGVILLTRHPRGVALTAAGQVFLEHAQRCLAQLDQMHVDLLPFSQGMSEHVTVFANNNALSAHLPDDLSRFFVAYPNVRITLEERMSHDIIASVVAGRADVGVIALETKHPALEFFPYREDQLILLTPLGHKLASGGAVRFAECLGHPFICLPSGAAVHTFLMNHASALDGRLDIRVQVSGYRAIARLVSSGAGIAIIPRSAVDASDKKTLAIVELDEAWSKRDLRVCVRRQPTEKNMFRDKFVEMLCGQKLE